MAEHLSPKQAEIGSIPITPANPVAKHLRINRHRIVPAKRGRGSYKRAGCPGYDSEE